MNLSRRNFKLSKKTVFVFKTKSVKNPVFSSDPSNTYSISVTNTVGPGREF